MMRGLFVTGIGTSVGKTFVTRGIARALVRRELRVRAVKPIETGTDQTNESESDAAGLARAACMRESDRHDRGYYRARAPLAPYAATLEGEPPPPSIQALANLTRVELGAEPTRVEVGPDVVLVEGAGGILTPIDRTTSIADLASALSFPTLLVARDELGVLSQVLCAAESAWAHRLHLAGVVLVRTRAALDRSASTNARILSERLDAPVRIFPCTDDDDDALAEAAEDSGIVSDIVLRALARRTG